MSLPSSYIQVLLCLLPMPRQRRIRKHCSSSGASLSSLIIAAMRVRPRSIRSFALYWYPVPFFHELTRGAGIHTLGITLLNEPLCLYRTNDGNAACVLYFCPHHSICVKSPRRTTWSASIADGSTVPIASAFTSYRLHQPLRLLC